MILLILLVDKIFLNICTVWREKKNNLVTKIVFPTNSASPRLQLRDLGPCSLLEMWAHWNSRGRNEWTVHLSPV